MCPQFWPKLVVAQSAQKGPRIEQMNGLYTKYDNETVQNDQKCSKMDKMKKTAKNGQKWQIIFCQNSF